MDHDHGLPLDDLSGRMFKNPILEDPVDIIGALVHTLIGPRTKSGMGVSSHLFSNPEACRHVEP